MYANFSYNSETTYSDSLFVEDVHTVYLEVIDADSICYYLSITTLAGESQIVKIGPMSYDGLILEKFSIEYEKVPSKDKTLLRVIQESLRAKKRLKSVKDNSSLKDIDYAKIVIVNKLDKESFNKFLNDSFKRLSEEVK